MKVSKIVTATTLCSLAAIAGVNIFRELSGDKETRSPDGKADQDAKDNQAGQTATGTTAAGKSAIAKPETLATQKLSKPSVKKPVAQAKAESPVQGSAQTLPIAPYFQTAIDRAVPVSKISPPQSLTGMESTSDRAVPDLTDPATFSVRDIQGHWAQYYIQYLTSRRVIQGFPDGNFRPDRAITATEFAIMTQKAFQTGSPISYRDLQAAVPNRAVTRAEAAAFIYKSLVKSEPAPIVTSIQVKGAVTRPGGYSMAGFSDRRVAAGNNLPTVARAIQQAGGSLDTANLRQVEVRRTSETGEKQVLKVDVQRILKTKDYAQDVVLQQNDQITIPAIAPTAEAGEDEIVTQSDLPK